MNVTGILETALHVADLEAAIAFYQRLFGFEVMARDDRFCAFNVAGRDVLLLFQRGASTAPMPVPGWHWHESESKSASYWMARFG